MEEKEKVWYTSEEVKEYLQKAHEEHMLLNEDYRKMCEDPEFQKELEESHRKLCEQMDKDKAEVLASENFEAEQAAFEAELAEDMEEAKNWTVEEVVEMMAEASSQLEALNLDSFDHFEEIYKQVVEKRKKEKFKSK
jgi:hypothetical protein